jgi:predicted metal-dependent hydrolase
MSNILSFFKKKSGSVSLDIGFEYEIKHSRRKSLCIQIKRGQVRVLAPMRYPKTNITEFVLQKQTWIRKKLSEQQQTQQLRDELGDTDQIFYKGDSYQIACERDTQFKLVVENQTITLYIPNRVQDESLKHYKKKKIALWFQQQANDQLPNRLERLSLQTSLSPSGLTIKQYKARWGSCNNKGHINLNYLLMMTPDFVIDYVIIHELCHLTHMNHSAQFWQLVAHHCPHFKQAKLWLKQHSQQLHAFHD